MTTEQNGISRRSFLTTAGGLALGVGIARLPGTAQAAALLPALPWKDYYTELDPLAVAKKAYSLYYTQGGCGHGSAQSIIDSLAEQVGFPWNELPRGLYSYGGGGVVSWGTICGALNGSIAVMDILGVHGQLGDALIDYFCNAELPTTLLVGTDVLPTPLATTTTSISHSPLCHNSVSIWAAAAGKPISSVDPQINDLKRNRCAKLVGDIVYRAVELMNDWILDGVLPYPKGWAPPASYATCYNCHSQKDMTPSQQGKMECQACHTVEGGHGSWKRNRGPRR
jgi:Putative redox-active protein (C_GCAxxG_C_C)